MIRGTSELLMRSGAHASMRKREGFGVTKIVATAREVPKPNQFRVHPENRKPVSRRVRGSLMLRIDEPLAKRSLSA